MALANYLKLPQDSFVIGNGSDQLIDLIVMLFLEQGDEAITISPTFSMYQHRVNLQKAKYRGIPLKNDFSLDIDTILASATDRTKLLILCSPNNPTANQFRKEDVQSLIEEF